MRRSDIHVFHDNIVESIIAEYSASTLTHAGEHKLVVPVNHGIILSDQSVRIVFEKLPEKNVKWKGALFGP